jgi:hypothetical protein
MLPALHHWEQFNQDRLIIQHKNLTLMTSTDSHDQKQKPFMTPRYMWRTAETTKTQRKRQTYAHSEKDPSIGNS